MALPRSFEVGETRYELVSDEPSGKPKYRAESGQVAVPTGRLFVRFAEGVDAAAQEHALEKLGMRVDNAVEWAPHTLWCAASDGTVASALEALTDVQGLPRVERVEPELSRVRAHRS